MKPPNEISTLLNGNSNAYSKTEKRTFSQIEFTADEMKMKSQENTLKRPINLKMKTSIGPIFDDYAPIFLNKQRLLVL